MFEDLIKLLLDPGNLIMTIGTIGVILIIFAESGLFFGFFLPGDSLLFTAGFLASQGYVSLSWLLVGTFLAAVIGDNVGYSFGKKIGPAIFTKEDSVFFNKNHIAKAQHFYEEHGRKTIILARFIPIVRTFAPIVAGIGKMNYSVFFSYNIVGGFVWTWGLLWLGYGFGSIIPNADRYILLVVGFIILTTAAPVIWKVIRNAKM